ncbi:ComF family protein [Joostella sp. CR20]|uniref:ComF family protein n=1 Tax=Joostella sp. CR20 TaxID=2804312 RepID=UPI00313E39A9
MIKAVKILNDLQNLFFPITCLGCSEIISSNDALLCVSCRHQLPLTQFITYNDNPTEKILYGRIKVENAASFIQYYKKGISQQLIHQLKYKGHQEVGTFFGKWIGHEILNSDRFKGIDYVVPVPLHLKKLKQRGYNQVSNFGKEIATAIDAIYTEKLLLNTTYTSAHALKNRMQRATSSQNRFAYNEDFPIENKHILLVDDVITTGATLESCVRAFPKALQLKFSIITIAITS